MLPSLARELGKATPAVACEDDGLLLTPAWAQVMRDVLVHAFRNALDHGLEPSDERAARGKAAEGRIGVRVERAGAATVIRVADDGRGLRLLALRQRAAAAAGATDDDVARAIFVGGVSTAAAPSANSGRGVGMTAIRSFVRGQGGEARIAFTADEREGCRPFALVLELPAGAVVAGAGGPDLPPRMAAAE